MTDSQPARMVTVWSDIGCPWATLALHTLRTATTTRGGHIDIEHRAFPLELFNREPTPRHILDIEITAIASLLPDLGWRCWSAAEATYPVTTLPAMAAVQAAKHPHVGGLRASDQLDAALRDAFYVDSRCISIPSVIIEAADACPDLETSALQRRLAAGAGISDCYTDYEAARHGAIQGSPVIIAAGGHILHNPGATYHWTGRPPTGFPRLEDYQPGWAEQLLDHLQPTAPSPTS